jgi:hypothetical protein
MFFPVEGTVGYSHGLILYVPFYAIARLFLRPFQAYNATLFVVMACGVFCLYALLRRSCTRRSWKQFSRVCWSE